MPGAHPIVTVETGTHVAKEVLEGRNLAEWEPLLNIPNAKAYMFASQWVSKIESIKDKEKRQKQEEKVLHTLKMGVAIGAERTNKFGDIVTGYFYLMNMRKRRPNGDGDINQPY